MTRKEVLELLKELVYDSTGDVMGYLVIDRDEFLYAIARRLSETDTKENKSK